MLDTYTTKDSCSVDVYSVHISRTAQEWLCGHPTPPDLIDNAERRVSKMWGAHCPTLILPYTTTSRNNREFMPKWVVMLRLEGDPTDPKNDLSFLALVLFTDDPALDWTDPISTVDWKSKAANGGF